LLSAYEPATALFFVEKMEFLLLKPLNMRKILAYRADEKGDAMKGGGKSIRTCMKKEWALQIAWSEKSGKDLKSQLKNVTSVLLAVSGNQGF
jgi:hypothetical protein